MKRSFSAPRTLRPTREGWWCLLATVGVGFAAVSTGNNLLYLLEAMLLALIVVSGLLSEMSMRGLCLGLRVPDEVFAGRPALFAVVVDTDVVVYPALRAVPTETWRRAQGSVFTSHRRAGRGHGLRDLREYRAGDDPRLIHWRLSAKRRALVVRELEEETALDARIVLTGRGAREAERREGALSEAAALARALLRAGAGVGLVGPGIDVPPGRGREQERRILTALALYDPGVRAASLGAEPAAPGPRLEGRDVRFDL